MGRKKSKKSDSENENVKTPTTSQASTNTQASQVTITPLEPQSVQNVIQHSKSSESSADAPVSWYGSWKGKSSSKPVDSQPLPSSSINIPTNNSSARPSSPQSEATSPKSNSPKKYLSASDGQALKTTPATPANTNINASSDTAVAEARPPTNSTEDSPRPKTDDAPNGATTTSLPPTGWFGGWFSRPDGYKDDGKPQESVPVQNEQSIEPPIQIVEETLNINQKPVNAQSWFWSWSRNQSTTVTKMTPIPKVDEITLPGTDSGAGRTRDTFLHSDSTAISSKASSINEGIAGKTLRKASAWAFWSSQPPDGQGKQVGEIAVTNTPSESNPEPAQFNSVEPVTQASTLEQTVLQSATDSRDLLLPQFKSTYTLKPTWWQSIKKYLLEGDHEQAPLHIQSNPARIKKAVAIGVHGFFPPEMFQKVLGAPTGTSVRFANNAANAIKQWTSNHGYECEIETVSLVAEGRIAERVNELWQLLLNYLDVVRSADMILIACHSQGVPVTVMLVERLIKFKCIKPSARVGVCGMAGINLGPFLEYRTKLFGRTALELFDFANPNSKVAKEYFEALDVVVQHNVKLIFIGSMDDQLVSLESSIFANISHPCICRSVYVDGRLANFGFIAELLGFVLKLRNRGLSDRGIIRELSPALAGSLFSGVGHSRLYDSPMLYDLAVSFTLETTMPLKKSSLVVTPYKGAALWKGGMFKLNRAMGYINRLVEENKELSDDWQRLMEEFGKWEPQGPRMNEVKASLIELEKSML